MSSRLSEFGRDRLTIVVNDSTSESLLLKHRESLEGLFLACESKKVEVQCRRSDESSTKKREARLTHQVGSNVSLPTSQQIVHLASGVVVGQLPPGVDRKKDTVEGRRACQEEKLVSKIRPSSRRRGKEGEEGLYVRKHSTQVRSSLEEDFSLVKSFPDELVLV